jgi:hypothetical protein
LMSEGTSDSGAGHPHLPIALRVTCGYTWGMTGFHRPNEVAPPVLNQPWTQGSPSSPGMTRPHVIRPESPPGTGTAADCTAPRGQHHG